MMLKQKILLILIVVLLLIFGVSNISRLTPESKNYKFYEDALGEYNSGDFSQAYYSFGKVSKFSKLKTAAIFRQALCASKLGDEKSEIKKYKEVIRFSPNSMLSARAKYLNAQLLYESQKIRAAKKEFNDILKHYPTTDFAIASQYYLGSIEAEKNSKIRDKKKKLKSKYTAINYFRNYLKAAPTGKFAINCVQKWAALNNSPYNEDCLIIAKIYQKNQDYKNAQKYLNKTSIAASWPYFVKNAFAMKDYPKVKYYTEQGIKVKDSANVFINNDNGEPVENSDVYEAIDDYIKISTSPITSISYLLSISGKSRGYDYLLYKNCNNLPSSSQAACFNTLFYQYPNGQFAAEALANIFYDKVRLQKYLMAEKLGREHLAKYPNSNSSPKVMFWLAKVAHRTKNYEGARNYYRRLMRDYPDSYYAYHAFLNLNRFRPMYSIGLQQKAIEFPYKNSGYELVKELANVKDYGLINQLYPDDGFIQSWLAYLEGNFSTSAVIARDAMEKLQYKPDRTDPRWRLVYPIHYNKEIKKFAKSWNNDAILILSIIREESYFNPKIKSAAGACGLMQLMPSTANEAGRAIGVEFSDETVLLDPDINIQLGNIYYSKLKQALWGKDLLAVLAYNGGLGSVSKWQDSLRYIDVDDFVELIPYAETQNYLKKVYRSYWNYLRIYDGIKF